MNKPDFRPSDFVKSSYSGDGTNCVEIALRLNKQGTVGFGDSKVPFEAPGHHLDLSTSQWSSLLNSVKNGSLPGC